MSDWLLFILLTLGVYRVAHMAAYEVGPFEVFAELRSWAVNTFGMKHWISVGLGCPLCLSFWLSAGAGIVAEFLLNAYWLYGFVYWLGIAGGVALIERILGAIEYRGVK